MAPEQKTLSTFIIKAVPFYSSFGALLSDSPDSVNCFGPDDLDKTSDQEADAVAEDNSQAFVSRSVSRAPGSLNRDAKYKGAVRVTTVATFAAYKDVDAIVAGLRRIGIEWSHS